MKLNTIIPSPEGLVASVTPRQAKAKLAESMLRARASVDTGGSWRKLPHAGGLVALALLLYAAAAFAPPGACASIVAMLATAALIAAVYYTLEFQPIVLKQAVLLMDQNLGKVFMKCADEEAQKLAATLGAGVRDQVDRQAKDIVANQDGGVANLKEFYADAATIIRSHHEVLKLRLAGTGEALDAADKELRKAGAAYEERTRCWWPVRLIPGAARVPARQWIVAIEKGMNAKLDHTACARATEVCEDLSRLMSQGAEEYGRAKGEILGVVAQANLQIDSVRKLQNMTGCNKQFPLPDEIQHLVAENIAANKSSIRHGIASRPAGQSLTDAIRSQALAIIAALPLPQSFAEFYAQRNGDKQLLLKQIDQQSLEFSTAEKKPGSAPIRHRFLMAQGGETSPACKDVAKISRGMLIRTIDNPQASEFVCVTESRFEPCSEITEFLAGVREFQSLPVEKRALMVVEVEDDDTLICYAPESAHDAGRPTRLLCLGLLMGLVKRTGAECYKLADDNDADNAPFAKGFDQAVDALATDLELARELEQSLSNIYSVEGVEAVRTKVTEGKKLNLVPASACKSFRDALDEECQRLNASQNLFAA